MTDEENENPPVQIPADEEGVREIAEKEAEEGVTDEQRTNLAAAQARLIGDIGPEE